jgi:hypothetical protein
VVEHIPAPPSEDTVTDAPKRLLAPSAPVEQRTRTIHMPAWSAAVYVRDLSAIDAAARA